MRFGVVGGGEPYSRAALGLVTWLTYWLREAAAIPWAALMLAVKKR